VTMDDAKDNSERPNEAAEGSRLEDHEVHNVHDQLLREKEEPTEGFSPVPIFLLFIFAAVVFWSGVYLAQNSGEFRWDAYSPDFDPEAEQEAPEPKPLAEIGERVFSNRCSQCHQSNGQGIQGVYPPLDGSRWVTGSKERVVKILLNGLQGPIEVAGSTYNQAMPAFGDTGLNLGDRQIAGVLTYVRQSWSNNASEISEDQVASLRSEFGSRSEAWTADELLEAHPLEE